MTITAHRTEPAPPIEPEDNRRATVKAWRRELAEWMREHGLAATGVAWDLATAGERDLTRLRRVAADTDPACLARHWEGHVLPAGLADGDSTPYGIVTGCPVTDPETGGVWIVTRRVSSGATDHDTATVVARVTDHELPPGVPVPVSRGKGARP